MLAPHRVTLKEIAARERVSVNAVSLALRNHPSISVARREKIQQLARELGYVPDPLLSALVARRRNTVAAARANVVAFISDFAPDSFAMAPGGPVNLTYTGACEAARTLGYKLEYFHLTDELAASSRFGEILLARSIRGVIFGPVRRHHRRLCVDWTQFARVTIGYDEDDLSFHHVMPNYTQAIALAWNKLLDRGYRRIGLMTVDSVSSYVLNCWLAAQQFQQNAVATRDRIPPLVTTSWSFDAFCNWRKRFRPEVVLSYNSFFPEWVARLGLQMPEAIGFVHLDRRPQHDTVAGIVQHKSALGAAAVTQLNAFLQHSVYGAQKLRVGLTIDCEWIEGTSIRPPP